MSYDFNGTSSQAYNTSRTSLAVTALPLTLVAWVKKEAATDGTVIQLLDADASAYNFQLYTGSDFKCHPLIGDSGYDWGTGLAGVTQDEWKLVATRYVSATSRHPAVGTTWGTENTDSKNPTGMDSIYIGSADSFYYFNGKIAIAGVFNDDLTQGELEELYAATDWTAVSFASKLAHLYDFRTESGALEDKVGSLDLTGDNLTFSSDNPTITATVKYLKALIHSGAAGVSSVAGTVFNAPTGSDITGAKIGEFTAMTFLGSNSLDGGKAKLLVDVASFGGSALTTANTPHVYLRTSSFDTGIFPATVIEV